MPGFGRNGIAASFLIQPQDGQRERSQLGEGNVVVATLPHELRQKLAQCAAERNCSESDIIAEALRQHLVRPRQFVSRDETLWGSIGHR